MPVCQDRATVEKFVELVRENPALYNSSLPEHRDAQLIHHVWSSIAESMGINCIDGHGWKKKWRNMRDHYIKKKKEQTKSGQATARRKPWIFFNIMTFLDEFIEPTREIKTESNLPPTLLSRDDDESESRLLDLSDVESASCAGRSSVLSAATGSSSPPRKKKPPPSRTKRGIESAIDRALLQGLINDHKRTRDKEKTTSDNDPDGDEAFFASCACRMKRLPARTKSFLRVQISQLFLNAENPDISPLPITPLP